MQMVEGASTPPPSYGLYNATPLIATPTGPSVLSKLTDGFGVNTGSMGSMMVRFWSLGVLGFWHVAPGPENGPIT